MITTKSLINKQLTIKEIKKIVNCILENGAYSRKNEDAQMIKKGDNYDQKEKVIVNVAWAYRRYVGNQMQSQFLEMVENDESFLKILKEQDEKIFEILMEMIRCNN